MSESITLAIEVHDPIAFDRFMDGLPFGASAPFHIHTDQRSLESEIAKLEGDLEDMESECGGMRDAIKKAHALIENGDRRKAMGILEEWL